MKRQRKGDGSIYKSKDGTWRAVLARNVNGKRQRKVRRAQSRAHARKLLHEMRTEGWSPVEALNKSLSLGTWLDDWLSKKEIATNTRTSYQTAIEHMGSLKNVELRDVQPVQIESMLKSVAKPRARENVFAVLRASLNRAVKLQLIPTNPCLLLDRPKHQRKQIRPFTTTERASILKAVAEDRSEVAVILGMTIGLRIGEILGLQWGDIDGASLTVNRQASETKGITTIKQPKSWSGLRSILLPEICLDALSRRRAVAMKEGNAASPWVFPNLSGNVLSRTNFTRDVWTALLKQLDIPHRGFHHTRHTAATLMLNNGVPIHVVSRILGHANPSITLNVYAHLMTDQREAAAAAIQRVFSAG